MSKYRDTAECVSREVEASHSRAGGWVHSTRDLCQRLPAESGVIRKVKGDTRANGVNGFQGAAARAAVDVLFKPMDLPEIVRVPGTLVVRQSSET